MEEPKLAVVIPTKDRRLLLARSLESALSQDYRSYRIVVVNDGSTDGTREYLGTLHEPRVHVIHHERSRGVNAARNAALRTLAVEEWAVLLDDDDMLLPGAFATIARAIQGAPLGIEALHFCTINRTPEGEFTGGYQFAPGETWHDQTYLELMTKKRLRGDGRSVFKASIFSPDLYDEDINGFESQFNLKLARDGRIGRCFPEKIMLIDHAHDGDHLSARAARENPASFVRANVRIFRDHAAFFSAYPRLAMRRAVGAMKVALRAYDLPHTILFLSYYCRALTRIAFGQREEQERER